MNTKLSQRIAAQVKGYRLLGPALAGWLVTGPCLAQEPPVLDSAQKRLSYALGMALGSQFRERGIEVDKDLYLRGLEDSLSGGLTLLTPSQARLVVNQLQAGTRPGTGDAHSKFSPAEIDVSFKLDPRLTRGTYMGERWVSPPTYTRVQAEDALVVDARADATDSRGRKQSISPRWKASDTDVLEVSPAEGHEVKLTALREGQAELTVTSDGISRTFDVAVTRSRGGLKLEISH